MLWALPGVGEWGLGTVPSYSGLLFPGCGANLAVNSTETREREDCEQQTHLHSLYLERLCMDKCCFLGEHEHPYFTVYHIKEEIK